MGMTKYEVKYKNSDSTVSIEADSAKSAYTKFLEQSDLHKKPVLVTALGGGQLTHWFSDHLNEIALENIGPTNNTQREILSQIKQIKWVVCIGFLYFILIIAGIIEPGTFR